MRDGQGHTLIQAKIPYRTRRLFTFGDAFHLFEKPLSQHQDSTITQTEMLLAAIRDAALSGPGDEILIHHVAGQPTACRGILDGTVPGWDVALLVGFTSFGNSLESPGHAECVLVIHRDAPFEMASS